MSNVRDEEPFWVADIDSIGEIATTKVLRRKALDVCLEQYWSDQNIGRLERVDSELYHGWELYRWQKAQASGGDTSTGPT